MSVTDARPVGDEPPPASGAPIGWRLALALAFAVTTVAHAVWPLRHAIRGWNDFAFIYTAGRAWLHGVSPYDVVRWRAEWHAVTPSFASGVAPAQPYLYPPHFALLAVPMALLPWPVAERLWDVINVAAFAGLVAFSVRLLRRQVSPALLWTLVGLAGLNAGVRLSLWECQMSLVPVLGVVGAFWATSEKRTGWLAVFGFLAALKPQLSVLPLLYLALNGGHIGLAWGAGAALVVSGVAMAPTHPERLASELAQCLQLHNAIAFNSPDRFSSLAALWAERDTDRRILSWTALSGLAVIAGLTRARRRASRLGAALSDPLWAVALIFVLTAALMPLHGYDLVLYTPLVLLAGAVRPRWLGVTLVVLVEVTDRQPVMARIPLHPVVPYFTAAIAILTFIAAVTTVSRPDEVAS